MLRKVYSTTYGSITVPNFTDTFDFGKGTFVLPILIQLVYIETALFPCPTQLFVIYKWESLGTRLQTN